MMWFRVFGVGVVCLCLLLVSYPSTAFGALPSRYALFYISNQRTLNSAADYEKSFHQWAQQNRSDYIMMADTYQLGSDGSIQYYDVGGETAEKYAFSTLSKMGLSTQAVFYTTSVAGIAEMLANPQPVINELIKRASQFSIGGYHLYYMPGDPLKYDNHLDNHQQFATSYADFVNQFGEALSLNNLTLTVGFMGCPSWVNLTCQDLSTMKNLLGAVTWDTLGANDIPSYQWFAQDDAASLGSKYCPQLFANYFNNTTWLEINQYLLQQNYSQLSTYPWNYWDQWDQPQWFFDYLNTFLDG